MRRRWICLRRLTPSAFMCLCLMLFSVVMLTLTTVSLNKTTNFVDDMLDLKYQRVIHNDKTVYTQNTPKQDKLSSAELYQDYHVTDTVHENNLNEQGYELIQRPQQYSRDMEVASRKVYISKDSHVPIHSNRHQESKESSYNKTYSFHNFTWMFDKNSKSSAEKLTKALTPSLNFHTRGVHLEMEAQVLKSFIDSSSNSERLLQHFLSAVPQHERFSISPNFFNLLKGERLKHILKSGTIQSENRTTKNLENSNKSDHFDQPDGLQKIIDLGGITHSVKFEASAIANDGHLNVKSNRDHLLSLLKNDMLNPSLPHSVTFSDLESLPPSITPRHRHHSRISHEKQNELNTDKYFNSPRKDNLPNLTNIVDGIYWSDGVEDRIPKGISSQTADEWIVRSRIIEFKSLQASSWNKCGRPKNGFALLMDDSETCVRYRSPNDRLLQGEVMSYWLARLLTLDNVPPVYLSSLDSSQWSEQQHRFKELGWTKGNFVATIMWIKEIDSRPEMQVLMPQLMLEAYRKKRPIDGRVLDFQKFINCGEIDKHISTHSTSLKRPCDVIDTVISLAQWGSMIIFDYLTGNYDRVASMQDGAEKEKKPSIVEESIRNLRISKIRGKLWLIDNESGLLDAYDLMYRSPENGQRFVRFHDEMLHTTCIFQRRVVERLLALHKQGNSLKILQKYADRQEPLLKFVEKDSSYKLFEIHFSQRLDAVVKWIHNCEESTR